MTRRMSVSMTVDAVRDRSKRVTRRHVDTWKTLKPGDRLTLIEKGMGLAKGEKQVVLAEVEIVRVTVEPVTLMTSDIRYGRQECSLEGLPNMTPDEFVSFWLRGHGYGVGRHPEFGYWLDAPCRRIEWRYLNNAHQCDQDHCCRSCGRHSMPHVGCILR